MKDTFRAKPFIWHFPIWYGMLIYEAGDTMKYFKINRKMLKTIFVVAMLAVLLATITSCETMFPTSTTPAETPEPEPAKTTSTVISTRDAAKLAVYQHLLDLTGSYDAKTYLSDFYTTCDNWTAQSDYFKDGSSTWHVSVNMTAIKEWAFRPYWQQASWFVFKDGEVIPSNLFRANALRIEADLQALSPVTQAE
jgi:hypothetical protein